MTPAAKSLSLVPFEKLKSSKAWKITSELVRKSGGKKYKYEMNRCYTCDGLYPIEKLVAGHFIEKRGNANTYFDLQNLKPQCSWNCNRMKHGAKDIYAKKLIQEYGPNIVKDLFRKAGKAKRWTKLELENLAEERSEMVKGLS